MNYDEKTINEVAQSIASTTTELLHDTVHWQIESVSADGDEYDAIHAEVMRRAIQIMHDDIAPLIKTYYIKKQIVKLP